MTIEQQAADFVRDLYPADKGWTDEIVQFHAARFAAFARHLSSQAPGNLSEEVRKIDEMLHFTAHKLTPSEAVKWLHDLYTEQCVTPQECAQRHKIGLGGEKLAKVVADAVDELTAARDHYLSGWVAVKTKKPVLGERYLVCDEDMVTVRAAYWSKASHGELFWSSRKACGEYMNAETFIFYAPLPIPPYTPQPEQR